MAINGGVPCSLSSGPSVKKGMMCLMEDHEEPSSVHLSCGGSTCHGVGGDVGGDVGGGVDVVVFTQSDLPNVAFPLMEDIRRQGKLTDIQLRVPSPLPGGEDVVISAHRVVLAAAIPYFHAMFTTDMLESKQESVSLSGQFLSPSTLETLINFAYSGRVTISLHNVQSLMLASSFLQLNRVRDACAEFLMTRLSPSNVIGVKSFAETLTCCSLVKACQKYIQKFFPALIHNSEFLGLSVTELSDILSQDQLHVSSESVVFEAVLIWVKHDETDRKEHLPELLSLVRLPLLTPHYLSDEVASEELIRTSLKCRDLIDEARDYHLMPERRILMQRFKTKPRRCKDLDGVIYAVGGQTKSGNSLSTVEVYDPILSRWQDAEAMSMLRSRVGVAVMKNNLYAIGGYNGTERLNTVEVFDAQTKRWSKVASMTCKRR